MLDLKSEIINDIEINLLKSFEVDKVKDIISILNIELHDFDVEKIKYEVVDSVLQKNEKIIKKFLVCKKIEGLRDNSLKLYTTVIKKFLKLVPKDLTSITADDIRYCLALLMQDNKTNDVTLDSYRRILKTFFNWMNEEEIINKNPILKIKKIKATQTEKEAFTDLEIEMLRGACKTQLEKALFEVLISSGARRMEIAMALRKNYYPDKNEVLILGKGQKERKIYLSARAIYELNKYLASRKDNLPFLFAPIRIKTCTSNKNTYSTIEKSLKNISKRAGVNEVYAHKFRRTAATLALKRGMPIEQVQQLLGHAKIQTTLIYTKIDQTECKNNFKKIMS